MGTLRFSGDVTQSAHTPLPYNKLKGLVPTIGSWNYSAISFAFYDDGGVFTNDTVDANSAAAGDVPLLPAAEQVNDAFYFGDEYGVFSGIRINFSQAAIGNTIAWEYYNGSAWVAIPGIVDGSNGLTAGAGNRDITFTPPSNWSTVIVNAQDAYWIRLRVTAANITQQPIATQIWTYMPPTALSNMCDAAWNTATTAGKFTTTTANEDWGTIVIDRINPSPDNPLMIAVKIGWWIETATSSLSVMIEGSADNINYEQQDNSIIYFKGTSVLGVHNPESLFCYSRQRYIRLRFNATVATTGYVNVQEAKGYSLGI